MKPGLRLPHMIILACLVLVLLPSPCLASRPPSPVPFLQTHMVAAKGGGGFSVDHAVLVEKQSQTLYLFAVREGGFREVFHAPCSTGEVPGAKGRSGDKKTPEGVYFFIKEHPDRDLAPIYGSRAFPIDYPNLMDRLAGRGGNAIWLHGTNKKLEPRDSNGCIVVENEVIDRLAGYIRLHRTPIIIVDRFTPDTEADRVEAKTGVAEILARWKTALSKGTYHDYLSVYDPGYLPEMSWWRQWNEIRGKLAGNRISVTVETHGPAVFHHRNLYTVLFRQVVRTPLQKILVGTRKLFVAKGPHGYRIVGDEDQALAGDLAGETPGEALVAASSRLKKKGSEHEIASMVDGWLKAWSSKDIDRYASYYSRDFLSQGGADLAAWIAYKDRLNRKYRFIRVTRNDKLTIERGDSRSTVTFVQTYASNAFKTTGVKKLILKREGDQWKIIREMFNQI